METDRDLRIDELDDIIDIYWRAKLLLIDLVIDLDEDEDERAEIDEILRELIDKKEAEKEKLLCQGEMPNYYEVGDE